MSLNYDYQLEPLRNWFLNESPKEAVLAFKKKCEYLLESPDSFMNMVVEPEFIKGMRECMDNIEHSKGEIDKIYNFIEHNQDEDEGLTAFEYLLCTKKQLSDESVSFIGSQFEFYKDMYEISSQLKSRSSDDEYAAYLAQVKEILVKTCSEREMMCNYLQNYADFMSELQSVAEANEKYNAITGMSSEQYESFLRNGKGIIDTLMNLPEGDSKPTVD